MFIETRSSTFVFAGVKWHVIDDYATSLQPITIVVAFEQVGF